MRMPGRVFAAAPFPARSRSPGSLPAPSVGYCLSCPETTTLRRSLLARSAYCFTRSAAYSCAVVSTRLRRNSTGRSW
jgi:hypothetical protein